MTNHRMNDLQGVVADINKRLDALEVGASEMQAPSITSQEAVQSSKYGSKELKIDMQMTSDRFDELEDRALASEGRIGTTEQYCTGLANRLDALESQEGEEGTPDLDGGAASLAQAKDDLQATTAPPTPDDMDPTIEGRLDKLEAHEAHALALQKAFKYLDDELLESPTPPAPADTGARFPFRFTDSFGDTMNSVVHSDHTIAFWVNNGKAAQLPLDILRRLRDALTAHLEEFK